MIVDSGPSLAADIALHSQNVAVKIRSALRAIDDKRSAVVAILQRLGRGLPHAAMHEANYQPREKHK